MFSWINKQGLLHPLQRLSLAMGAGQADDGLVSLIVHLASCRGGPQPLHLRLSGRPVKAESGPLTAVNDRQLSTPCSQ